MACYPPAVCKARGEMWGSVKCMEMEVFLIEVNERWYACHLDEIGDRAEELFTWCVHFFDGVDYDGM